jgi:hypothetical protein
LGRSLPICFRGTSASDVLAGVVSSGRFLCGHQLRESPPPKPWIGFPHAFMFFLKTGQVFGVGELAAGIFYFR